MTTQAQPAMVLLRFLERVTIDGIVWQPDDRGVFDANMANRLLGRRVVVVVRLGDDAA